MTTECDLLIVGGGPAGLCAAINGASEGLKVCLLDGSTALGGQAKQSNAIENYPLPMGYPHGVTGEDLMAGFIGQSIKFETDIYCPTTAASLIPDANRLLVTSDDYHEYVARTVLLALGLNYRRHPAKGIGPLMGRGVFYGLPTASLSLYSNKTVGVVGGANSAGQAVLKLAQNPKTHVKLYVRKRLVDQMSTYLIDRIRATANIEVCEGCNVVSTFGNMKLEGVEVDRGPASTLDGVDFLFLFIGATPQTLWLKDTLVLDDKRFIQTDGVLPYETSVPNVFAVGDVRSGSTKRISAAIGEGSAAIQSIHRALAA